MMGAGTVGVARRHWDITFADSALSFDYPGAAFLMMGLNGLFAIMAAAGGIMYLVIVVGTILKGRQIGDDEAIEVAAPGVAQAVGSYGSETHIRIPGTTILVAVFFAAFVLYYFVNWKYLSEVWPLS